MPESPKGRFELTVELIKATAWPLFASVVLIAFWSPLRETANQVPDLVGRSDSISIAGLSLKVGRDLRRQASDDVLKVLPELSGDAIKRVLGTSGTTWWDDQSGSLGKSESAELVRLGLMEEIPEGEIAARNREGKSYGYAVRLTERGRRTQSFLFSVVAEFTQQLQASAEKKASG